KRERAKARREETGQTARMGEPAGPVPSLSSLSRFRPFALSCKEEASPPTQATGAQEALLARILFWTGGHPYLTQRFCQAAAAENAGNPKSKRPDPGTGPALR